LAQQHFAVRDPQFPPHGDVHLSHGQCTFHGNTTLPRKPDLGVNQIQKVIGTG
jgi:hypothetical protein